MGNNKEDVTTICIPRVDMKQRREYILNKFAKLEIGNIQKMFEIPLRNNTNYKRIIIKLKCNLNSKNSQQMINHLNESGTVKLVYDMPWYWKVCLAR